MNRLVAGLIAASIMISSVMAEDRLSPKHAEFFESKIRPVLVEHCYECHNSAETSEGDLAVDHRAAFLKGGDGGAIIVPGKPNESRLLPILRHEVDELKMPENGPKLDDDVVADFEKWIEMGAPDPRDKPPTIEEVQAATSWQSTLERRKQWWSFQPIGNPAPPKVASERWNRNPIDRFVLARLSEAGLQPGEPADAASLVRRLYFNLTGLPPTADQAARWTEKIASANETVRSKVIGELVDELLASPRFGERWARHWMDWIRYAESHGSEGDPAIENAWFYRDYLIRALNEDVPYDQLVREHVAGDLLKEPRINEKLGINESAIGPAHWRMVFHGFAPTDALDEKVRFIDDQINSFSKAFMGLTVSCARCHDHKFDAISQADYYALFGVLASCRPARNEIDTPAKLNFNREELAALKPKIRDAIANDWTVAVYSIGEKLSAIQPAEKNDKQGKPDGNTISGFVRILRAAANFDEAWNREAEAHQRQLEQHSSTANADRNNSWSFSDASDYAQWNSIGNGLPDQPQTAGEFAVSPSGDDALTGIYPSGVYSHSLSSKHVARLTSNDLRLGDELELWVRVIGNSNASVRYVVEDYPRNGTVYPVTKLTSQWRWQRFDLAYWNGDSIHVELATARDAPLLVSNNDRSWFGIREAMIVPKGQQGPSEDREFLEPIFAAAKSADPKSIDELVNVCESSIREAIFAWKENRISDAQALMLDSCIREGLLPNKFDALTNAKPLLDRYRQLENEIPVPNRVPGLDETTPSNQPLMVRGNHKLLGEPVPRRFLEAIDTTPYGNNSSGRLELASDILRDDNPLARRVIVNRIWHHLFGRGIVATPDNFGRLGSKPTHPELLDWLASRFVADDWSMKKMIRLIVTSETWQQSSQASEDAIKADPGNQFLGRANVRRLEAEAIRDSLLLVSGRLEQLSSTDKLTNNPVDGGANQRSIYVRVRRNSLEPFLRSFDFPEPYATVGRRDATNVPAQSLAMLNDASVSKLATAWANKTLNDSSLQRTNERVNRIFMDAFGRPATLDDIVRSNQYLVAKRIKNEIQAKQLANLVMRIEEMRSKSEQIKGPVRKKLMEDAEQSSDTDVSGSLQPFVHWEFDNDLKDSVGESHGTSRGDAKIADGALIVRNGGYVVTAPLQKTVRAKTLVAWVQLDNLQQSGGGVITIQSEDGNVFDSIVFAELAPKQWLAGSNNHRRSKSFNGPAEVEASDQPVCIAITWHEDGRIIGYRNGNQYGETYKSEGPQEYPAGKSVVSFGVRHLPAGGNRLLSGKIDKAQLYDRALTAEEITAVNANSPNFVSETRVLKELDEKARTEVEMLTAKISKLESEAATLKQAAGPQTSGPQDETKVWADFARAIFTFKEFIYVR